MANQTQKVMKVEVEQGGFLDRNQPAIRLAFFNADGDQVDPTNPTGATVKLTGYAAHAAGPLAAGDTVNVALAKLEARVVALETA